MAEAVEATTGILDVERRCESSRACERGSQYHIYRTLVDVTHLTQLVTLHQALPPSIARSADGGREQANERLKNLELDLDALRDDLLQSAQDLLHEALLQCNRGSAPTPSRTRRLDSPLGRIRWQ